MRDEMPEAAHAAPFCAETFEDLHMEVPTGLSPTTKIGVSSLALATAACGGGGGSSSSSGGGATAGGSSGGTAAPTVLKPQTDAEAARFILRASIAASNSEIASIKERGYEPWLNSQMSQSNNQSAEQFFAVNGYDDVENEAFFNSGIADQMIWKQLMLGSSGVRKRVALALSEFFVVSINPIDIAWRAQAMGYYWDTLNDNAFGNFRDLLEAISLNPAMGVFLNTRGNQKADPETGRVPDENYGREVMQLFSIGLYELNLDGSVKTSAGEPIETYTNDDVTGIAKAFTGYDFDMTGVPLYPVPNQNWQIPGVEWVRQPMTADPAKWRWPKGESFHSGEEKSFLGVTIPAGTGPAETLRQTMDTLFNHPNVGPFFAKQMIQRLVTSNPAPAYVQRVAQVFNDNGSGQRGDLRAVFKAILLDDDALSPSGLTDQRFGKLREPMLRFAQWGRTFGASSPSGKWNIADLSNTSDRLGQAPLRSPSVFNFFRPGYTPLNSTAEANNMLAPEFQLVNESSVAGYVNFMDRAINGRGWWLDDVAADYASELPIAHDAQALIDRLDLVLTAGQLSQNTKDVILAALQDEAVAQTDGDDVKLKRIHIATLLVMVSNDYLVQK